MLSSAVSLQHDKQPLFYSAESHGDKEKSIQTSCTWTSTFQLWFPLQRNKNEEKVSTESPADRSNEKNDCKKSRCIARGEESMVQSLIETTI